MEDDDAVRFGLTSSLRASGYVVHEARGCAEAVRVTRRIRPDVVLLDLCLSDGESIELLPLLRSVDPAMGIFMITGFGTIDAAVRAVKAGADDFFTKPLPQATLHKVVSDAMSRRRRSRSGKQPKAVAPATRARSLAMATLEDEVHRLRNADCSVLILGETGTGKSELARRLHAIGARAKGPLVEINCAGLSREFVESELFGHERGAFTGAHATKPGLFDAADGGTMFLDEIGDIDLQVQPKLLKVLEERRYRRIGDVVERSSDVRLIAATHHDLLGAVATKAFRADLFYRVSTVTLTVPPLRERREDILPLAEQLLVRLSEGDVPCLSPAAEVKLLEHAWPGNIRELSNVIERALLLRSGDTIGADELRFQLPASAPAARTPSAPAARTGASRTLAAVNMEAIRAALEAEGGRVEAAARRLGIPRSTLYWKLKHAGLRGAK